jgi:glycosyltransferase involved in cell wall biosynthesis
VTGLGNAALTEARLAQRLKAVHPYLVTGTSRSVTDLDSTPPGDLLWEIVSAVAGNPTAPRAWLLLTAIWAAYPTSEDVEQARRVLRLSPTREAFFWFLDRRMATDFASAEVSELQVVTDEVVVDVDQTAREDLHTGIQQVVRSTFPVWMRSRPVLPAAWTTGSKAWRGLTSAEERNLLEWQPERGGPRGRDEEVSGSARAPVVLAPWQTVVVLLEFPRVECSERLAALAEHSGNRVAVLGYDCIPVLVADMMPPPEPPRFAHFLTVVKHSRRVAAISRSASEEFAGFAAAAAVQGLPTPEVVPCLLPDEGLAPPLRDAPGPSRTPGATHPSERPIVLAVGSLEPRKNHLGLLFASEVLWREGHEFELELIAGSNWGGVVERRVDELREAGRPVRIRTRVSPEALGAAYAGARFTVLASFHEGFGLPVVESLAAGTPAITSGTGSLAEAAAGGGTVLVDPYDDDALISAMRTLLTDDRMLERLRDEARSRTPRTWEDYASDLWDTLVAPELLRSDAEEPPWR